MSISLRGYSSRIHTSLLVLIKSTLFESKLIVLLWEPIMTVYSVGNISHVHFAADVFSLPLKTAEHPHSLFTVSRHHLSPILRLYRGGT